MTTLTVGRVTGLAGVNMLPPEVAQGLLATVTVTE